MFLLEALCRNAMAIDRAYARAKQDSIIGPIIDQGRILYAGNNEVCSR